MFLSMTQNPKNSPFEPPKPLNNPWIEGSTENKSFSAVWVDLKTVFMRRLVAYIRRSCMSVCLSSTFFFFEILTFSKTFWNFQKLFENSKRMKNSKILKNSNILKDYKIEYRQMDGPTDWPTDRQHLRIKSPRRRLKM